MEGDLRDNGYNLSNIIISIHSLRMEGDCLPTEQLDRCDISIHSLRMEGDSEKIFRMVGAQLFQSTPSAWRETGRENADTVRLDISIHSLRMEGDRPSEIQMYNIRISIHSLRMEGDR